MDMAIDLTAARIDTARLLLRAWRDSDLDDFYAYASVPGVGELAGWKHHASREESRTILRAFIEDKNVLALEHKPTRTVIGSLGFHPSWANDDPAYAALRVKEIGYVLSQAYWGQGLMPEAVQAAIAYAFEVLDLDALTVGHFDHNHPSRRVIEKCGFTYVGRGTYYAKPLQQSFDDCRYILLRPAATTS